MLIYSQELLVHFTYSTRLKIVYGSGGGGSYLHSQALNPESAHLSLMRVEMVSGSFANLTMYNSNTSSTQAKVFVIN